MGILAAWGMIMLIWVLGGVVLLPLTRRKDVSVTVTLKAGEYLILSRYLRAVVWLRDSGLIWWDIVILADELREDDRMLLELHSGKQNGIRVMNLDEYQNWMEE